MHTLRTLCAALLIVSFPAVSQAQDAASTAAIAAHASELFNDPSTPAYGNPTARVTLVEFFDYQCGYCKSAEAGLEQILREDSDIKVVYKDFAKLGPLSVTAANVGLASLRQGPDKYIRLHYILMNKDVHLSGPETLYQTAAYVGLDTIRLQNDSADPAIVQQAAASMALGRSVGVSIVPSFVIGKHLYPGFQSYDQLKQIIAYERTH